MFFFSSTAVSFFKRTLCVLITYLHAISMDRILQVNVSFDIHLHFELGTIVNTFNSSHLAYGSNHSPHSNNTKTKYYEHV